MPPIYQDGPLPHGSFNVVINETGQSFIATAFATDNDSKLIRAMDANGVADRQKIVPTFVDGSCELQFDNVAIMVPDVGSTFAVDANQDGVVEPYIVVKPGRTYQQDDMFKAKVTIAAAQRACIYFSNGSATKNLTSANGVALANTNILTEAAYLPNGHTLVASSWSASGLPAGLTIAAGNGTITGTPTRVSSVGHYWVSVQVQTTVTFQNVQQTKIGVRSFEWVIT